MERTLQAQENALNAFQQNIQPGRIGGIVLYFYGANAEGETADQDDLGTIVIKRGGQTIVNRPAGVFAGMGDIRAGSNLFVSEQGGEFRASVFIPFYALSLEQALNVTGTSELNFDWQPKNGNSDLFANLTVSVFAQKSFRTERYTYKVLGDDQTPAGAVSGRPYQLNKSGISEIYIRDKDDVLQSVGVRQDGQQRFSDQPKDVLIAGTLYDNLLEVNNTDMIQLETYTKGQMMSTVNENTVLELTTTGPGNIEITVCSIEWHEEQ